MTLSLGVMMNKKIRNLHRSNKKFKKLNKPEYLKDHHIILTLETTDGSEDVTLVPFDHMLYYSHLPFSTCKPVFRKNKINGN